MVAGTELSDEQVAGELRKMVQFIKQEALEKSREIQIKADEEFAIEKAKIVRAETVAIDAKYDAKVRQLELAQQIAKSTIANKSRLKVLSARQGALDSIFDEAGKRLSVISKDKKKYSTFLAELIVEGLYTLLEPNVVIRVRKEDKDIAKSVESDASKKYEQGTGRQVKITVDDSNYLPSESSGGVIIVGGHGKIEVTNTIEERLRMLSEESLPAIRLSLYGPSPTRKFFT